MWKRGGIAGMMALGLVSSSCYRSRVETTITRRNSFERRTPLEADGPLAMRVWHFREGVVVTQLKPATCRATRDWVTTEMRTTTHEPIPKLAGVTLGLGLLSELAGVVTFDADPEFYCDGVKVEGRSAPSFARSCEFRYADNTLPKVLMVTGAVLIVLGTIGSLESTSVTKETVAEQKHHFDKVEPCVSARELAELVLAVRGPAGRLWPVQLDAGGNVSISTQQSPALPRGVELELIVFSPPRTGRTVLSRGKVLDTFELPVE